VVVGFMVENLLRNVSVWRPAYVHSARTAYPKPRFRLDAGGALVLQPSPVASSEELQRLVESRELLAILDESDYWVQRARLGYHGSPIFRSSLARLVYAALHQRDRRDLAGHYRDTRGEPFLVSHQLLLRFVDEARANGARAVVVIFPHEPALRVAGEDGRGFWSVLTDRLVAEDVEVLDLTPWLLEAAGREGPASLFRNGHYNAAGNAVVSRALQRHLLDEPDPKLP
jgi:hypothetical protein